MTALSNDDNKEDLDLVIARLHSELEDLREKGKAARVTHGAIQAELQSRIGKMDNQWRVRMTKSPVSTYNRLLLMGDAHRRLVPTKVLSQQSHLCRTLHTLEVLDRQMTHLVGENQRIVTYMRQQTQKIQNDKTQTELSMMNQLFLADAELNMIKEQYQELLRRQGDEIENLQQHNAWDILPSSSHVDLHDESKQQREDSFSNNNNHREIGEIDNETRNLALRGLESVLDLEGTKQDYPQELPPTFSQRKRSSFAFDRQQTLARLATPHNP